MSDESYVDMESVQQTKTFWAQVQQTDPKYTKSFKRAGGFSGTAIDPMYLIREASRRFGMMGYGWGLDIERERIIEGHPLKCGSKALLHVLQCRLWYLANGRRQEFSCIGQTHLLYETRNGEPRFDEEAPKKSLTDALSKGLSWLGFGADVFLGLFDDNKYVRSLEPGSSDKVEPDPVLPSEKRALIEKLRAKVAELPADRKAAFWRFVRAEEYEEIEEAVLLKAAKHMGVA